MFFHIEGCICLNLGATKSQLISGVFGPFPCTGSLVWSAFCMISSFHGSPPPGARPLTSNLASRASDWVLGSMIPKPLWEVGSVSVSHLTLARPCRSR